MPSSSRSRVPARRSPRPAPRSANASTASRERPLVVPFAGAFGVLLTLEILFVGWLFWSPDPSLDRYLVVPLLLAALSAAGSVLVLTGRRRGWVVLAVAAVLPLPLLLVWVFLLGVLGGGGQLLAGVLLLVGPVVTLVLALRRPVREWCCTERARRSAVGRRGAGAAR